MCTVPTPLDSPTCATTAAARPLPQPRSTTTTTISTSSSAHDDDNDDAAAASGDGVVHRTTTPRRSSAPAATRPLIGRQLLLRLMPQLHDVTDTRNYWLPYCVIFASGVGCSLLLMFLLNTFLVGGHSPGNTIPIMHTLPAGHFLQVRDEFQAR